MWLLFYYILDKQVVVQKDNVIYKPAERFLYSAIQASKRS